MANILEELLVEVGIELKKGSLDALTKSLKGGAIEAVAFGDLYAKAIEKGLDAVGKIIKATIDMTAQLDTLYFASRRIGDSAENIQDYAKAMTLLGETSEEAMSTLENFGHKMREMGQGGPTLIQAITGVDVSGMKPVEQLTVLEDKLSDLYNSGDATQKMMAEIYAGEFGLSDKDIAATRAERHRAMQEYQDDLKLVGLNQDQADQASHEFQEQLKSLNILTDVFGTKLLVGLIPVLKGFVSVVTDGVKFIAQLNNAMDKMQQSGGTDWTSWAQVGIAAINLLTNAFFGLIRAGAWFHDHILAPMGPKMGPEVEKQIAWINQHLPNAPTIPTPAGTGEKPPAPAAAGAPAPAPATGGGGKPAPAPPTKLGPPQVGGQWAADLGAGSFGAGHHAQGGYQPTEDEKRRTAAAVERFLVANGISPTIARGVAGGIYAEAGSPISMGLADPRTGHRAFGIMQLLGAEEVKRFAQMFGHDVSQSNLLEQAKYLLYVLKNTKEGAQARGATALEAGKGYIEGIMRPGPGTAGDEARLARFLATAGPMLAANTSGGGYVQNNNITINAPSGDAHAIATATADAIKRQHSNAKRAMQGAMA